MTYIPGDGVAKPQSSDIWDALELSTNQPRPWEDKGLLRPQAEGKEKGRHQGGLTASAWCQSKREEECLEAFPIGNAEALTCFERRQVSLGKAHEKELVEILNFWVLSV